MSAIVDAWEARGRPFTAAGVQSRVWEEGEGEPVVCVHGVPASAFIYRKLLPELAARGLQGVTFDLPGLGLAERPRAFDYTWSGLAGWVLAALEALEIERFHLVVHDIAGPIGFDAARQVPSQVRSLTALNTLVRVAAFTRPWTMEPFARRGIGEVYLRTLVRPAFVGLMRLQGVSRRVPAREVAAYLELLRREDGGRAFLQIMRGFERTQDFERRILTALRERPYPAQVLWGDGDPALRADRHGEDVRAALGLDHLERLPGKHFVMEDCAPQIAEAISSLARAG
jgi:haloalkane dehalogenase